VRTQADPTSPRLRRSLSLCLAGLLIAVLVPPHPANADHHMPWDQPGSYWMGTIDMDVSYALWCDPEGCGETREEQGHFTLNAGQGSNMNANDGVLLGSFDHDYVQPAPFQATGTNGQSNTTCGVGTTSWDLDSYRDIPRLTGWLELATNDAGFTSLESAVFADVVWDWNSGYCSEEARLPILQLWRPAALSDQDPDPLHLVGSESWTKDNPPFADDWLNFSHFNFSVTYDLRLVQGDPSTSPTPLPSPTECSMDPPGGEGDADGDRLPDSYETDVLGTDPAEWDTDSDCYSDAREVANGSSPLDGSETPDTLPNGLSPKSVVARGDAGVTCGQTKFKWVTPTLHPIGVSKDRNACIFLLSNRVTNALIDYVLDTDKASVTSALATFVGPHLLEIYGEQAIDWAQEAAFDASIWGGKFLAKGKLLKALRLVKYNHIFTAGTIAGMAGVAYGAFWGVKQVRNNNACIQVRIGDGSDGTVLSWSLVYSQEQLTHEGLEDELHKASIWKKKEVDFGIDRAVRRSINLKCNNGNVVASGGGAGEVFDSAVSFVF